MDKKNINDEIVDFLQGNSQGVDSISIAEKFLKFINPDHQLAHITVSGILKNDSRCIFRDDKRWYFNHNSLGQQSPKQIAWAVIYRQEKYLQSKKIVHISIWSPFETPSCLYSNWLLDHDCLSKEEQDYINADRSQQPEDINVNQSLLATILSDRRAVFISLYQQTALRNYGISQGLFLADNALLIGQLYKINELQVPSSLSLKTCYKSLFGKEPVLTTSFSYGKAFSDCLRELITRLADHGITTEKELDSQLCVKTLVANWGETTFSLDTIINLPQTPGVYGFKNKKNKYIYIGKAANLKRHLMIFYHHLEELPSNLKKVRQEAYDLTIHHCGSELESLIYGYRLRKKYSPHLNAPLESEELNSITPCFPNCIILLPHSQKNLGMSFWFREKRNIAIYSFKTDFSETEQSILKLQRFYYHDHLPQDVTDLKEKEMAYKWVNHYQDSLTIISISMVSSAEQLWRLMREYWNKKKLIGK